MNIKRYSEKTLRLISAVTFQCSVPDDRMEYCHTDDFLISKVRFGKRHAFPAGVHRHSEYEFLIPVTPIPCLVENGNVYYGDVNAVYAVHSQTEHGLEKASASIAYTSIIIDKEFFESVMRSKGCLGTVFNTAFECSFTLKSLIDVFCIEFCKGEAADKLNILEPVKKAVCAELISLASAKESRSLKKVNYYQKGLSSAIDFINDNYDKDISIDDLAAVCGLSHSYFTSCFKSSFGETPKVYITKLRLSKAKYYLKYTSMSINDISEKCGFCHLNTFTSAFKQHEGISPRDYRRAK